MPRTQVGTYQILDGGITRADLNTTTSGSAVIAKLVQGTGLALTSTGVDAGTGDVTVALATSGVSAGTYAKVTVDVYGRVTGSSSLVAGDIPSGSAYYIQNQNASAQSSSNFWISGTGSLGALHVYSGSYYTAINSGTLAGNITLTLPTGVGSSGNVLSTDGTGVLSFIAAPWVRSGTQVNLSTTTDKVTIGATTNNAGALGIDSGSIQLKSSSGTISLIHFEGRSGSRQVIDLCGNRWYSPSVPTPASISTAQGKFGNSSLLLNGSNQYIEVESQPYSQFAMGTGSFTVEFQVYFSAVTGTQTFFDCGGSAAGMVIRYLSGTGLQAILANTTFSFTWSPSTSTWYHVAVVRNGTSLAAYVNGTQIGTTQTSSGNLATGYPPVIGAASRLGGTVLASNFFNGYMDEFRFSNLALWTANFTAPTAAYDTGSLTMTNGSSTAPLDAGWTLVSDAKGNMVPAPPRRVIETSFALTEFVSNTTMYFYADRGQGTTQDNAARSGNSTGMTNSNSCSPIIVPFNGRITKAILAVQATGVNQASATYPCAYNVNLYRVGWTTEQDSAVNSGSPNAISFPISSGVGGYSVTTTNALVEVPLNIQVSAGDRLGLKFVNGATAAIVGLTQMAFVTLLIEEVM